MCYTEINDIKSVNFMERFLRRAWAEISLDDIGENYRHLKKAAGDIPAAAVVKANAYGHDDSTIALYLQEMGVKFFAVSNIKEALTLRECGVKGEILILGYTPVEYACVMAENDIIGCAVGEEYAVKLNDTAKRQNVRVKIHLAIDSGMGRIGERTGNAADALVRISKLENIILDGAFTHYAVADTLDDESISYTKNQTDAFFESIEKAEKMGVKLRHKHCLNSAGGLFSRDEHSTLIRDGILLYGLKPDRKLEIPFELHPAMTLKAVVSYVKKVPTGTSVSYGRTYTATNERVIATIPIGYADGYPRSLSNKGYVLIKRKRAPIVGRVCMDQLMADVTDIDGVCEGDTAVLIGKDGNEVITADDIAELCDTIGYEIVCGISKRVPRVIFRNGEIIDIKEYY